MEIASPETPGCQWSLGWTGLATAFFSLPGICLSLPGPGGAKALYLPIQSLGSETSQMSV